MACTACPERMPTVVRAEISAYLATLAWSEVPYSALFQACRSVEGEFDAVLEELAPDQQTAEGGYDDDPLVAELERICHEVVKDRRMLVDVHLPGVGKVKARRVMEDIGIADNRRVQGLGAQQRHRRQDLRRHRHRYRLLPGQPDLPVPGPALRRRRQ